MTPVLAAAIAEALPRADLAFAVDNLTRAEDILAHPAVQAALQAERARCWAEGYRGAIEDYGCDLPWGGLTSDENPYLEGPK